MHTVRFSELKKMALSPAHYLYAVENKTKSTRSMSVGTIAHAIVLGARADKKLVVWEGTRRGKLWDEFAAEHAADDIVTSSEWKAGEQIAESIARDPVAAPYLKGRHEVPLEWESAGMRFATRGIDVIGDGFVAELKSTSSAEPSRFQRLAVNMGYHTQLALYRQGAAAAGLVAPDCPLYIIGCESSAPFPVTVMRLGASVIELAEKTLTLWIERLRTCLENDHWPTYAQSVVELDAPAWMTPDAAGDDE